MQSSAQATVHHAMAVQLGLDIEDVHDDLRLDRGLDMHALDLARVGLHLEYSAVDHGAFPFDMLHPSMTVGEIVTVYRFWLTSGEGFDDAPDTLRMDLPPASLRASRHEARSTAKAGTR